MFDDIAILGNRNAAPPRPWRDAAARRCAEATVVCRRRRY
jgi:hypothetical protein